MLQFILKTVAVSAVRFWRDALDRRLCAELTSTHRLVTQRWTQCRRTPLVFTSHLVTWGDMWRSLTFTCKKYDRGWNCKMYRLFWVTGSLFLETDTGVYNTECIFLCFEHYKPNAIWFHQTIQHRRLYNRYLQIRATSTINKTKHRNKHKTGWTKHHASE